MLLAGRYAEMGREEDSRREAQFALALRPNDSSVLYNCACAYRRLGAAREAIETLRKAWEASFKDSEWARRDPDLALLQGTPEFEVLLPAGRQGLRAKRQHKAAVARRGPRPATRRSASRSRACAARARA